MDNEKEGKVRQLRKGLKIAYSMANCDLCIRRQDEQNIILLEVYEALKTFKKDFEEY